MRRIFDASPKTDLLLEQEAKRTGKKLSWIMDNAVYSMLTPWVKPLAKIAEHIISEKLNDTLTDQELRTSMSQGIAWLERHPTRSCAPLRGIFAHYSTVIAAAPDDAANEYVLGLFRDVEAKIKEGDPSFTVQWYCYAAYAEEILDHWDLLWDYPNAYKVLSAIISICKPRISYDWYDGILFLREIEALAEKERGLE